MSAPPRAPGSPSRVPEADPVSTGRFLLPPLLTPAFSSTPSPRGLLTEGPSHGPKPTLLPQLPVLAPGPLGRGGGAMGSQGAKRQISWLRDQVTGSPTGKFPWEVVQRAPAVLQGRGAQERGHGGSSVLLLVAAPRRRLGHSPRVARPAHEAAHRPANGPCCAEQVSHVGGGGATFHGRFISTLPMWLDSYRKGFLCPPPLGVCTVQGDGGGDKRVPRWPWAPHPPFTACT